MFTVILFEMQITELRDRRLLLFAITQLIKWCQPSLTKIELELDRKLFLLPIYSVVNNFIT